MSARRDNFQMNKTGQITTMTTTHTLAVTSPFLFGPSSFFGARGQNKSHDNNNDDNNDNSNSNDNSNNNDDNNDNTQY